MVTRESVCRLLGMVALGLVSCQASAGSLDGVVVTGGDTEEQRDFIEVAAGDVVSALPAGFLDGLFGDNEVRIHVQSLNEALRPEEVCESGNRVFGRLEQRRGRIVVSQKLLQFAMVEGQGRSFDCTHGTYKALLRATIAHELAHAFDNRHRASALETFSYLTGGETRFHKLRRNKVRNFNAEASPDAYELRNLSEAFATNFEFYLLDASYPCARPAFTAWFDSVFQMGSTESVDRVASRDACADHQSVLLHSQFIRDNLNRAISLSPDRIYEIHYLYASRGPAIASRWGHGMFRLVTCAPHREQVGPECLADTAHHVVLSYRANVADVTISYLRGLFGSYPSQLFVYTMPEIVKEYTRHEFRDLLSIPLVLSESQKEQFLNVALERFWGYQGKYYFLSNHCGTEAVAHLGAVDADLIKRVRARTPRSILRSLPATPVVDAAAYDDIRQEPSGNVYHFPSKRPKYEQAYRHASAWDVHEQPDLRSFLRDSESPFRRASYAKLFAREEYIAASVEQRQALLAHLLLLERLQHSREMAALGDAAVRILLQQDEDTLDRLRSRLSGLYVNPWDAVEDNSYGIPSDEAIRRYLGSRTTMPFPDIAGVLAGFDGLSDAEESFRELTNVESLLIEELRRTLEQTY